VFITRVYFNVQFYTKCAVLNPFVQFLKHKCAVTKRTKIALKQSSHLFVTLVDASENARNAVIEHQKYKRFLGEDLRPSYFPHKSLTCWGNGKEGKIGASEAPKKEIGVGEPNILCRLKSKFKVVIQGV
jgi:hypothetical protein